MRIYVLVLDSLTPGQKVVQGSHAILELTGGKDTGPHDVIVALKASSEKQLSSVFFKLTEYGYKCAKFEEPDMDNKITAVAAISKDGKLDKFFKQFQTVK